MRTSLIKKYSLFLLLGTALLTLTNTEIDYKEMLASNTAISDLYSDIKDLINESNDGWTADIKVAFNFTKDKLKELFSTFMTNQFDSITSTVNSKDTLNAIPEESVDLFDLSEKYHSCQINVLMDQGRCSSDWAIIPVSIIKDKLCMNKGIVVSVSAQDVLECTNPDANGCTKGHPLLALNYIKNFGVVTGGTFLSNEGCKNYKFYDCHHIQGIFSNLCLNQTISTSCSNVCDNGNQSQYIEKINISNYNIVIGGEESIKREIYNNGPVIAIISVFQDLLLYVDGVYSFKWGSQLGFATVKIIGWGKMNGLNYWKVVFPWGETFGKNGVAYILRGIDMLNIESVIYSVYPQTQVASTSTSTTTN